MTDSKHDVGDLVARRAAEERLRLGEAASGIATFEYDVNAGNWSWSPQAACLFLGTPDDSEQALARWEDTVFPDDLAKIRAGVEEAKQSGRFHVEFRVRHSNEKVHWIVGKGQLTAEGSVRLLRGAISDITERKALEARLLALNETLEARVIKTREDARTLEVLNQTGVALAGEHDLHKLVQRVTDAGVELSHAAFGAFFYNVLREDGEAYTLYTLSGAPREAFEQFPMPRNTAIFEPTFRGRGPMRSNDILADPRYGKNAPYHGMPKGHLPVRSYLAVPVVSRSGEVLGGLFFGHAQTGVFTERAEGIVTVLAAQASVAIDNARLHKANEREIGARREVEQELQRLNQTLEQRAEERARQLATRTAQLEDTERRFRLLVESVTDYAIYMLDERGHVVNWNAGAARRRVTAARKL